MSDRRSSASRFLPWVTGVLSIVLGSIALLGWLCEIGPLKNLIPGLGVLRAATSMSFILLGGALCLLSRAGPSFGRRLIGQSLALFVCISALLTLGEYLFQANA